MGVFDSETYPCLTALHPHVSQLYTPMFHMIGSEGQQVGFIRKRGQDQTLKQSP